MVLEIFAFLLIATVLLTALWVLFVVRNLPKLRNLAASAAKFRNLGRLRNLAADAAAFGWFWVFLGVYIAPALREFSHPVYIFIALLLLHIDRKIQKLAQKTVH